MPTTSLLDQQKVSRLIELATTNLRKAQEAHREGDEASYQMYRRRYRRHSEIAADIILANTR